VRVLWLIKGLGPGGAERLLVSAAHVHDRDRFSIDVAYLLAGKDHLTGELAAAGVTVHLLSPTCAGDPRWPWRLRRLLGSGRYDVVHVHSPLLAVAARALCFTLGGRRRPRLMSTEHNVWSNHAWPTRVSNFLTWGADDVRLAVSDDVRASVWPPSRRRRVEVLLHGTELAPLRAARAQRDEVRRRLGVRADEILVGTVANFRAQKAYPDLLQAARHVLDRGLPVRFIAAGQGPLEAEVRRLHAELALGERFSLLGYRDDVPALLGACDVFVMTSRNEGSPVAVMEAVAAGLPVVATDVTGIDTVVRHDIEALLVPAGRPELMAGALARVASDPELRERLAVAASRRAEHFDISRTVRRLEELYRSVVTPSTVHRPRR